MEFLRAPDPESGDGMEGWWHLLKGRPSIADSSLGGKKRAERCSRSPCRSRGVLYAKAPSLPPTRCSVLSNAVLPISASGQRK